MPPKSASKRGAGAPDPSVARDNAPKRAKSNAAAHVAPDSQQSGRADAQTKHALAASRRAVFECYDTAVLYAWGTNQVGWTIPRADAADRERTLTALSNASSTVMPASAAQMEKCWRKLMKPGKHTAFPVWQRAEEDASEDSDDDMHAQHGDASALQPGSAAGVDPRDAQIEALQQQLRHQHVSSKQIRQANHAQGAQGAAAATAPTPAPGPHHAAAAATTCSLCYAQQMVNDPSNFRCTACGQIPHLGFDHDQNKYWRQHAKDVAAQAALASTGSGQSNTTRTATSPSTHLTKREKEFERLAAEHGQLQAFASTTALSVADALRISRQSYAAATYTPTPPSLLKLIQYGALMRVGHALPRALAAVDKQAEAADTTLYFSQGRLSQTDPVQAPPLTCLRDFTFALFSTILPALVGQPMATAHWFALARTVHEMDRESGWAAASAYLDMLLSDRIHRDMPFGDYDRDMVHSATRPQRAAAAGPTAAAAATHAPALQAAASASAWLDGVCRDYNKSTCTRGAACHYAHTCAWAACTGTDRRHPAFDCAARSPSFRRTDARGGTASVASSSRGGRGGKSRGGGRGGGAGSTVASTQQQ